ncbi:MAG: DnaJ domain-containing protein [Myxococcaceae bacterium]
MPQIFVRDAEGTVRGPLEPVSVELLIEAGALNGALLVSTDGVQYRSPARYPALKDFFPRHLWADDGEPLEAGNAVPVLAPPQKAKAASAAGAPPLAAAPRPPPAVPAASTPPAVAPASSVAKPPAVPAMASEASALPKVTAAVPVPVRVTEPSQPLPKDAVPAIPPMSEAPRKTPTGSFSLAPPSARPTPAAPFPAVPGPGGEARFSSPGLDGPRTTPTPASPMPVPPRTATPRPPPAAAPTGSSFMVASGELAEISAIRLYAQGAETNVTGLFTFELPDRTIVLHFRKGNPELIDSNHPEDAADVFLSKASVVTAEQLKVAQKEKGRFGGDVLATLFALGLVNPAVVFPALTQRAAALLLRAFLAPQGVFRYQSVELPPSKALPLGNRWGFLAEVLRRFPLAELKRRMMDVRQRPLVRRGDGGTLPDLRFSAQEMRALATFDGTRSLALLAQSHPQEMEAILRVALLLRELDALSFPEVELKGGAAPTGEHAAVPAAAARPAAPAPAPTPPPTAPRPAVSATPSPSAAPRTVGTPTPALGTPPRAFLSAPTPVPGTTVDFEAETRLLRARLEKGKSLNHFQILGLSDKADGSAVKAAYFKLAKLYHPDMLPPDAPVELAELRAQAFAMVGEASKVLGDDQSRADYLESLKAGGGSQVDVRQLLAAEDTFHKGVAFIKARRFGEGVKALDDAITLNPREGEFYAWRGYARFFTSVDKKASLVDAMRDLHHALKLNERCAPAHYLIGQLHKLSGDNTMALKHFKKCVLLDGGHVDAQREIRLLVGR